MSSKASTPFSLHRAIPSRLRAVDALCLDIRALFQKHGLAAKAFAIELVVRECLNNAVLHGNSCDGRKHVSLDLVCARKWIHLRIRDEGPGFDWRRRFNPALPDSAAHHGRGMPIIAQFAERARFNRRGNEITLWMLKHSQSQPECR